MDLLAQRIHDTDPALLDEWQRFDRLEGLGFQNLEFVMGLGFKRLVECQTQTDWEMNQFIPWYEPPEAEAERKRNQLLTMGATHGRRSGS